MSLGSLHNEVVYSAVDLPAHRLLCILLASRSSCLCSSTPPCPFHLSSSPLLPAQHTSPLPTLHSKPTVVICGKTSLNSHERMQLFWFIHMKQDFLGEGCAFLWKIVYCTTMNLVSSALPISDKNGRLEYKCEFKDT